MSFSGALRMQEEEEEEGVKKNEGCWAGSPPPWSRGGEGRGGGCGLRTPRGRLPRTQPISAGFFQAVLYLPAQYPRAIPTAALTLHAAKC